MNDVIFIKNSAHLDAAFYGQDYFIHLLCHAGSVTFRMENKGYEAKKNDIVIWLPNFKVNDVEYSNNFRATYLLVSFPLMSKNNPDLAWGIKGYLFSKENPVVHLSNADFKKCLSNFELLVKKAGDHSHHFKDEILNLQLKMFVLEIWNIFYQEFEKQKLKNQNQPLFQRFLNAIQEFCMEHRDVDFYARQLFVSPKYLNEISKKNSGKTASEWIETFTQQRLILLLRNRNLTLTEIADALHFSSMSFFSRYVKKLLGVSPREYREKVE